MYKRQILEYRTNGTFVTPGSEPSNQEDTITRRDLFSSNGMITGNFVTRYNENGTMSSTTHNVYFPNTRSLKSSYTIAFNSNNQYTFTRQVVYNIDSLKVIEVDRNYAWPNGEALETAEVIRSFRIHDGQSLQRFERTRLKTFENSIREEIVTHYVESGANSNKIFYTRNTFFHNTTTKKETSLASFHSNGNEKYVRNEIFFDPAEITGGADKIQSKQIKSADFNGNVNSDCTTLFDIRSNQINRTCR